MLKQLAETLADVIGQENAENLVNMCQRVRERAIERESRQSVEMLFNENGHVIHINGSDNINGVKPRKYRAE